MSIIYNNRDGRGKAKTPYISQKLFPTWENLENKHMREYVESISNDTIRNIFTVGLSSGFRICEILNSYVYYDSPAHTRMLIRAPAEKKREFVLDENKHKIKYTDEFGRLKFKKESTLQPTTYDSTGKRVPKIRGFLGEAWLKASLNDKIWKSREIQRNLFGINTTFLDDNVSFDMYDPHWLFPKSRYNDLFKILKKDIPEEEVFYFPNKMLEEPIRIMAKPSFHYLRKCVASKMIQTNSLATTVNYLAWDDINTSRFYIKIYKLRSFKNETDEDIWVAGEA